jgi:hypothetical protein
MNRLYSLAALVLALTSCDTLTRPTATSLKGTYQYTGQKNGSHFLYKFKLTGTKFIANFFLGEQAFDYTVEDGYLYMKTVGTQYPFKVISSDTLYNEGTTGLEGTYVRVK